MDKTSSTGERRNIDILGNKYELAPDGYLTISQSCSRLCDLHAELHSYAVLFKHLEHGDVDGFAGIGITLERFSRRLLKIVDRLETSITGSSDDKVMP